jgi:hypothetical protein
LESVTERIDGSDQELAILLKSATRGDAHTIGVSRAKAGMVVQTGTIVISQDGKTNTVTTIDTDENGRQINDISVSDKQ